MIQRLLAVGFIFLCASIAWLILAGVTERRTHTADRHLRGQVESAWGAPQRQEPPAARWTERVTRQVETVENGRTVVRSVEKRVRHALPLQASTVEASLRLAHRQKGLLWYATYSVAFSGSWVVANPASVAREVDIALPFPARNAVFDDLQFEIVGKPWLAPPVSGGGRIVGRVRLEPNEMVTLRAAYRSQGLGRWTYSFGQDVAEVRNFRLALRTDFAAVDFPEGAISPQGKAREGDGWRLTWEFRRLVTGAHVAVLAPQKAQPGPLAAEIAAFAPVSLFFFIVVMLTISIVRRVDLHPMHFFFLSAAFFAFHLLFAYLADQIAIAVAFSVAAAVSLALVTSYLWPIFGARLALIAAAAQLLYLVLFSGAFFIRGMTGLAITLGAVATLFVLMQVTTGVDWREVFAPRAGRAPRDEPGRAGAALPG